MWEYNSLLCVCEPQADSRNVSARWWMTPRMQRPVDALHRRAHLHHGAHLPLGKFKLLQDVHVLPAGLLGFNEEEGGQRAPEHWCFLRHPACSAEWLSVRSSRLYLSVILLEQLLCRHSPSSRSFTTLSLISPSPSIYTTFPLTPLLERTPPPPLISDNPDHGDDKLTPACLYLPRSSVVSLLRFPAMPCRRQDAASPLRVPWATPNISDLYSRTS